MVPLCLAALLAASAAASNAAEPGEAGCSNDVFSIDGTSVTVALCAPAEAAPATKLTVIERVTVRGQPPLLRTVPIDRVSGTDLSHTLDDVSLEPLGISRTLHLTIYLRGTTVRLEHALMIPGAVALK